MIVYTIPMILCLIFQLSKLDDKKSKIAFNITITILFLISAIRYNVGKDYQHCIDIYNWIENNSTGVYVEIAYKYLNIIIQKIPFMNVYYLFITTSAFIIFSFGYMIKKEIKQEYWFVSIFIFIGSGVFFATLNLIRQYIAITIILLALPLLRNRKYIEFFLLIILASLFHTSAIIMLPFMIFYIIFHNYKFHKILTVIYIISLIFMIIDIRQIIETLSFIIPQRWQWYLNSEYLTSRNTSAIVKQLVPNLLLIFIMLNRKKEIIDIEKNDIYILMLYTDVIITNCFYGILVLLRFSYFFDISLIFIIPVVLELLKTYDKKIIILGNLGIWGYYILLTVVTIFIMNGQGVMPYNTLLSLLN